MFGEQKTTDYGKQALMRVEDLQNRLDKQLTPVTTNSAVILGQPRCELSSRTIKVGKIFSQSQSVGIIFKYTPSAKVQLFVNDLMAINDQSNIGIAFAHINLNANKSNTVELRGSGYIDGYELYFSGVNAKADSISEFNFDFDVDTNVGLGLLCQGGSVFAYVTTDDKVVVAKMLTYGLSADCVVVQDGFFVCVVDGNLNLFCMTFDKSLNFLSMKYLQSGVNSVAIGKNDYGYVVAMQLSNKLFVGTLREGKISGLEDAKVDNVQIAKWAKNSSLPILVATTAQGSTARFVKDSAKVDCSMQVMLSCTMEAT